MQPFNRVMSKRRLFKIISCLVTELQLMQQARLEIFHRKRDLRYFIGSETWDISSEARLEIFLRKRDLRYFFGSETWDTSLEARLGIFHRKRDLRYFIRSETWDISSEARLETLEILLVRNIYFTLQYIFTNSLFTLNEEKMYNYTML